MPVMKESNSGEWLKEVEKRADRLKAALAVGQMDRAQAEARELTAASQILYDEVQSEKESGR